MISPEAIEQLILAIRDQKVILDSDLAGLYGIPTFRFNEAIKRSRDRFLLDFILSGREQLRQI